MMMTWLRNLLVAAAALAAGGVVADTTELVMVEERGCIWCARWNTDISDVYPKTAEGQYAPLRRIDLNGKRPDDLSFSGPLRITPTFVLMQSGVEVARFEGYPGEDFFWAVLEQMLVQNTDYKGETQ